MSNALTTTNGAVSAATLEAVVVGGDLSKLTAPQRLEWYRNRCEAAGLDPRTQPFQYLNLSGKLTLYATKAATDQLIATHSLTVSIKDRKAIPDLGLYEVVAVVTFPSGRTVEDMAALSIVGLKGEALANAVMKCVTKAKRRTVLSACGLGMMDETEAETIPGSVSVPVDLETGELPEQPKEYTPWDKAQRRLRAIMGKAELSLDLPKTTVAALVREYCAANFQGRLSTKDLTAEEINTLANAIDADPKCITRTAPPVDAEAAFIDTEAKEA